MKSEEKSAMHTGEETTAGSVLFFFTCFFRRATVLKSIKVALVVGPVLVLVNHFEILFGAALSLKLAVKLFLCFLVPFCVSGYSTATSMMNCRTYSVRSDADRAAASQKKDGDDEE
jgi:hypothetical protein